MNRDIKGLDTFDFVPDYTKSEKENEERYREEYKKAFGEYPEEEKQ